MKRLGFATTLGLGVLVGVMALAGCSASPSYAPAPQGGGATEGGGYENNDANGNGSTLPADRLIIRTATITLVVSDVKVAAVTLHGVATNLDGWISSESITIRSNDSGSSYGSIQLSVPSERLDDALNQIEAAGDMVYRSIQSEDVTEQVADIDSRIATMRASIARLQELMSQSGSVMDIASIESQLTQRESDLESMLAIQKSLAQRVATATIDVSLTTTAPPPQTVGAGSAFLAGWHALATTARYLFIALMAVLPWAAAIALIVVPIVVIRRKRRAKNPAAAPKPVQAPLVQPAPVFPLAPVFPPPAAQPAVVQPASVVQPATVVQPVPVVQPTPAAQPAPVVQPPADTLPPASPPTPSRRTTRTKPKPQ